MTHSVFISKYRTKQTKDTLSLSPLVPPPILWKKQLFENHYVGMEWLHWWNNSLGLLKTWAKSINYFSSEIICLILINIQSIEKNTEFSNVYKIKGLLLLF